MSATENCRHLVITGRVQGVGFRQSMQMVARSTRVTGWTRNRRDGSVEATICGEPQDLARMLDWARHGPSLARVEHVAVELGCGDYDDFTILPRAD